MSKRLVLLTACLLFSACSTTSTNPPAAPGLIKLGGLRPLPQPGPPGIAEGIPERN